MQVIFLNFHRVEVTLTDLNPETLKLVVEFMYTDKIAEADISLKVLAAASNYNILGLFSRCEEWWGRF
jgi:hypothetical protein